MIGRVNPRTASGRRRGVPTLRSLARPSRPEAATSGTITQKIACQEAAESTAPATVCPRAGPTAMTTAIRPITVPRRSAATTVMVTAIIRGSTTAVPAPWKSRSSSWTPNHGTSAASRVPSRNAATATMKTARVENRSSIQPVVGMTTAIVSMKPVSSH